MTDNEPLRRRLIEIRREFAELLWRTPPAHDQAAFHCGVWGSGSVGRFVAHLRSTGEPRHVQTLEMLPAGKFLFGVTRDELRDILPADWNQREIYSLADGGEFSASISGLWRHLSALYARACSGRVYGLVAHDRATLHKDGIEQWKVGSRSAAAMRHLKVWGFVEFPILAGALSRNAGVTRVDIYVEDTPGNFRLIDSAFPQR